MAPGGDCLPALFFVERAEEPGGRLRRETIVTIKVLYFAAARERAGTDSEKLDLEAPISVAALVTRLCEARPRLGEIRGALRVAVNLELVANEAAHLVAHGDEVALIPPVSGG